MTFPSGQSGNPGAQVKHGFYKKREKTCVACGRVYISRRLSSSYCSHDCMTDHGPWSYPAAHHSNARTFGFTKES